MRGAALEALTPIQQKTLTVIVRLREKNGITPTQRELVTLLGVTQNAVRTRLKLLAKKGRIRLLPRLARGIVVLDS
jgi:SOS-response transcriptional repressor LexA